MKIWSLSYEIFVDFGKFQRKIPDLRSPFQTNQSLSKAVSAAMPEIYGFYALKPELLGKFAAFL